VILLIAVLLVTALLGGIVACTPKSGSSSVGALGIAVYLPEDYAGKVEITPEDQLADGVIAEVWHTASRDENGEVGLLFRIVRKTDAQWEDYWNSESQTGGARPFARDGAYVYALETPADAQGGGLYGAGPGD
jgi:hypothetical protein